MNKNLVNEEISTAYEAIKDPDVKISENGISVKKEFRGQISSFGAAITMGSLTSAIAFFADKGGSKVDKTKLLKAIMYILNHKRGQELDTIKDLFDYADRHGDKAKEEILNASLAIKMALNLYEFEKTDNKSEAQS